MHFKTSFDIGRRTAIYCKRHMMFPIIIRTQAAACNNKVASFRTEVNNPVQHSLTCDSKYYVVPAETKQRLFDNGCLPGMFQRQVNTFGEMSVLIRKPALELFNYLRVADYSKPVIRYIFFGKKGSGKTISLLHALHYGAACNWLLVNVPWAPRWFRKPTEIAESTTNDDVFDLPVDGAAWLSHFKAQNSNLIKELDLRISKEYVWSKRESTSKGASLLELVDLGISRIKYANDIVFELMKEIKQLSTSSRCKTLIAIDGFNAFFYEKTRIKLKDRRMCEPASKVRLTEAFVNITKSDWCNGAIILTVDEITSPIQESYLPSYLLQKQGFEHVDPFVPIYVPEYDEREIETCLDYYIDRQWIQNKKGRSEEGRKELEFLSGRNPYNLMMLTSPL